MASSSALTWSRNIESVGRARTLSGRIPPNRAAFSTEWCAWSDVYTTPRWNSGGSRSRRAVTSAIRLAMDPPEVSSPPEPVGSPVIPQNHSITFCSSCTSAGAASHIPVYLFVASAMRSATADWNSPPPGT